MIGYICMEYLPRVALSDSVVFVIVSPLVKTFHHLAFYLEITTVNTTSGVFARRDASVVADNKISRSHVRIRPLNRTFY